MTFEKFGQDNGDALLSAIKGRNSGGEGGHDHVDLDLSEGRDGIRYTRFGLEKLQAGGAGGGEGVYPQHPVSHPESQRSRRLLQTNNADAENAANEELLAGVSSYQNKVAALPNDRRQAFVQVYMYVCMYGWMDGWMDNCVCV